MVLVLLFFVCEILPIIALLDYSYLNLVGLERVEIRPAEEETVSSQTLSVIDPPPPEPEETGTNRSVRFQDEANEPLIPSSA